MVVTCCTWLLNMVLKISQGGNCRVAGLAIQENYHLGTIELSTFLASRIHVRCCFHVKNFWITNVRNEGFFVLWALPCTSTTTFNTFGWIMSYRFYIWVCESFRFFNRKILSCTLLHRIHSTCSTAHHIYLLPCIAFVAFDLQVAGQQQQCCNQACNQLGTPGVAKNFLRGLHF